MGTNITDNYFEYSTLKYFRGLAENQAMGSYGEKKDPIGPEAHLDVQSQIKTEYLAPRVKYVTTVDIDWTKTTKAAVEVNGLLKYFGLNLSGTTSASYEKAKTDKLKLAKFVINEGDLQAVLNNNAIPARNYLADEGSDGRVVSTIWVIVSAQLGEHFSTYGSTSGSIKANGSSLDFTVTGGSQGSQKITISKESTFAYGMHKVKNWSNSKTHIDDMEADFKGMG